VVGYNHESYSHKPNPGMAMYAAYALDLDLTRCIVVGDRITDIELAQNIGAYAVYIGGKDIPTNKWQTSEFKSLADAAGYIIERITGVSKSEFPTFNYTGMTSFWNHYADETRTIMSRVMSSDVSNAADTLLRAYQAGRRVFIAGNGGAASIANHFECDHTNHMAQDPSWFTNIHSLSSNVELITAAGNDIGFDSIFSYQLERKASPRDVLMVFTVSGNSGNIVRAVQCATELGMQTIAVTACDGGKVAGMTDTTIHIPSSNYGVAEDIMQMIMHSLAQFIRQTRMSDRAIQSARF
jgi:phosphoheptose isomerase